MALLRSAKTLLNHTSYNVVWRISYRNTIGCDLVYFLLIPSRVRARKTSDVNIRKHLETSGQKKVTREASNGRFAPTRLEKFLEANPNVYQMYLQCQT